VLENLSDIVDRLKGNPEVIGLMRYGAWGAGDVSPGGDFDLFVFLENTPNDIESLHFHVSDVPVDLNLRTLDDLHRRTPLTNIDAALADGEVLYDKNGRLAQELSALDARWTPEPMPLAEHDSAMNRFCQRHVLDKVRRRIATDPLLCEFLLATNVYWIVQTYFRVRGMPFRGEKEALAWLESNDQAFCEAMKRFYAAEDLSEKLTISDSLTEQALAPIGGPWRDDELLALGRHPQVENLQAKGQALFATLFGNGVT